MTGAAAVIVAATLLLLPGRDAAPEPVRAIELSGADAPRGASPPAPPVFAPRDDDLDDAPRGSAPGRYARVRVHDTGPGIPEAIANRIFDPFFTTKPEGQGTGLGLASALTIARDHGGTLDVSSTPGAGTTATLCLPIDRAGSLA